MRETSTTDEDTRECSGDTPKRKKSGEYKNRSDGTPEKASPAEFFAGNDFLTTDIKSIFIPDSHILSLIDYEHPEEITEYVRSTFTNYAKLMGRNFNYDLKGDLGKDLHYMLSMFSALISDCDQISVEYSVGGDKRIQIHLISDKHFCDTIYSLPIACGWNMPDSERRLFEHFVSFYEQATGACFPCENDLLSTWIDDYDSFGDNLYADGPDDEYYGIEGNYAHGPIRATMDRIRKLRTQNMRGVLSRFAYMNSDCGLLQCDLYQIIKEGVDLLENQISLCSLSYNELEDVCDDLRDYDGEYPVTMDRLLLICYKCDDPVMREYEGWINEEAGNCGSIAGYQGMEITPDTDQVFKVDPLLPIFNDWFNRLIGVLERYYERDYAEADTEDDA